MTPRSRIFLQLGKKPTRDELPEAGLELLLRRKDLVVLSWQMDFSDLQSDAASAELLLASFGGELLAKHQHARGVLVTPASRGPVQAEDYASAIVADAAAGLWLAAGDDGRLVAADASEIPLSRFPRAKRVGLHVLKPARVMQELQLAFEPLRCVRLELLANATPREVSAFYLPQLKAHGLQVKRRVWSSGVAERLSGDGASEHAVVHAARVGTNEVAIALSWLLKR